MSFLIGGEIMSDEIYSYIYSLSVFYCLELGDDLFETIIEEMIKNV